MTTAPLGRSRRTRVLATATVLCYLIGYPLALLGHSPVGWVFVSLGGALLLGLGVTVVRRLHAGAEAGRGAPEAGPP